MIEALLFDLGGVIVDIDFDRAFSVWSGHSRLSIGEIKQRFHMDAMYEQHECGDIQAAEYFSYLRKLLELDCDNATIIEGWNAVLAGEIKTTVAMLSDLDQRIPRYLLTNSNPTHEACWRQKFNQALEKFSAIFVSSTLGLRKPDPAIFAYVMAQTGHGSSSILFFDDAAQNVQAAQHAGLQSVQVRTPADVRQALLQVGFLS